jgi:hypothetical protein
VDLGALAAGASRALGPYAVPTSFLGKLAVSGLGKAGAIGKTSAAAGFALDLGGDLNGLLYDSIDFGVYALLAAGGTAGLVETGGFSAALAATAAGNYYVSGGSKGLVQSALCGGPN